MDFFKSEYFWLAMMLISGAMLFFPMLMRGVSGAKNVSAGEAVQLINREHAVVLDVRSAEEFAGGHIAQAINIPVGELAMRLGELKKYQEKPLLVNCQAGMRSEKACAILAKSEFKQLYNLTGGINGWAQAQLPLSKGAASKAT